jgi:hypothetical protein
MASCVGVPRRSETENLVGQSTRKVPSNPTSYMSAALNGVLIGTYFAVVQPRTNRGLFAGMAVVAIFAVINFRRQLRSVPKTPSLLLGTGLLLTNVAIVGWQESISMFASDVIRGVVGNIGLLLLVGWVVMINSARGVRSTMASLAFAFAWYGAINVGIDAMGLGSIVLVDRTEMNASRYFSGGYRWQAPLYSSWQLSGLLRWSVPILLVVAWQDCRNQPAARLLLLGALTLSTYVLILCEFRAAVFPLIGTAVWFAVRSYRIRAAIAVACALYSVAVPFALTSETFLTAFERHLPDSITVLAGDQTIGEVLSLSGRTDMWAAGIEVLQTGKYLWLGQGHVLFDATADVGAIWGEIDPVSYRRLSYHQSFLDLMFIYGVVPAAIIAGMLITTLLRGWQLSAKAFAQSLDRDGLSFAMFSIGIMALANCHDGFLVEHNFFYVIAVVAALSIAQCRIDVAQSRKRNVTSTQRNTRVATGAPQIVPAHNMG